MFMYLDLFLSFISIGICPSQTVSKTRNKVPHDLVQVVSPPKVRGEREATLNTVQKLEIWHLCVWYTYDII